MQKRAFCITMYDEVETTQHNIDFIRRKYKKSVILVAQSDSGNKIKNVDVFKIFPNLGLTLDKFKIPAYSLSRNYSFLFSELYKNFSNISYITALTGDTLLLDLDQIDSLHSSLEEQNKKIGVSQAIGQDFHAANSNPPAVSGGRLQIDGISDFMPQFFIVDGKFAYKTKVFSTIQITNEFTSEQCLGDEFMRNVEGSFKDNAFVFSSTAYGCPSVLYHRNK